MDTQLEGAVSRSTLAEQTPRGSGDPDDRAPGFLLTPGQGVAPLAAPQAPVAVADLLP